MRIVQFAASLYNLETLGVWSVHWTCQTNKQPSSIHWYGKILSRNELCNIKHGKWKKKKTVLHQIYLEYASEELTYPFRSVGGGCFFFHVLTLVPYSTTRECIFRMGTPIWNIASSTVRGLLYKAIQNNSCLHHFDRVWFCGYITKIKHVTLSSISSIPPLWVSFNWPLISKMSLIVKTQLLCTVRGSYFSQIVDDNSHKYGNVDAQ